MDRQIKSVIPFSTVKVLDWGGGFGEDDVGLGHRDRYGGDLVVEDRALLLGSPLLRRCWVLPLLARSSAAAWRRTSISCIEWQKRRGRASGASASTRCG